MTLQIAMKKIFVTPSHWLIDYPMNTLIRGLVADEIFNHIRENPMYKPREAMEENPAFRQIIPYVLVQNREKFVLMQRGVGQNEKRLHGNFYIGVGGHIDYSDYEFCPVEETVSKEMFEETGFNKPRNLEFVGVILKDETPVDKVHLGMLYHYVTDERLFNTPEMSLHNHQWASIGMLRKHYNLMEPWSKVVMDEYVEKELI